MKNFVFVLMLFLIISISVFSTTFWISWEGEEWFKQKARDFETATGEKVEIVYVSSMEEKLGVTVRGSDNLPDICMIKNDQLPLILNSEMVKLFPDELKSFQFNDRLIKAFSDGGKAYSVPLYADIQLMYASRNLLEKLNIKIDETRWDLEYFLELMKQIRSKGVIPSGWALNSAYIFMGMQEGMGTAIYDSEGNINVMTEDNAKLFRTLDNWYKSGYVHDYVQRPDMMKAFLKNNVVFVPQGSFLIQKFEEMDFPVMVLPLPYPWKTVIDPKGICFFSEDKTAREFTAYILEDIEALCAQYIKYPSLIGDYDEISYFDVLQESFENGFMQPSDASFALGYWPAIRTALDLFFKGELNAEQALEKAQEFIANK